MNKNNQVRLILTDIKMLKTLTFNQNTVKGGSPETIKSTRELAVFW
jgi:hypothetical protein